MLQAKNDLIAALRAAVATAEAGTAPRALPGAGKQATGPHSALEAGGIFRAAMKGSGIASDSGISCAATEKASDSRSSCAATDEATTEPTAPWDAPQSPAGAAPDQVTSPAAPPAQQALLSTCGSPHGEAQAESGGARMEASPGSRPSTRLREAQASTAVSPPKNRAQIDAAAAAAQLMAAAAAAAKPADTGAPRLEASPGGRPFTRHRAAQAASAGSPFENRVAFGAAAAPAADTVAAEPADLGSPQLEASPVSHPLTRRRAAEAATAVTPTVGRVSISAAAGAVGRLRRSMRIHTTTEVLNRTTEEQRSAGRVSASGAGAGAEAGRGRKNSAKSSAQAVQASEFDACIAVRRSERTRGNGGGSCGGGAPLGPSEAGGQLEPPGTRRDRDSARDALRRVRTSLATMEISVSMEEVNRARAVLEAVDARGGSVLIGLARAALEALDIRSGSAGAHHVVRT